MACELFIISFSNSHDEKTFIRPLLEYACTVLDPATQKDVAKIEMIQGRAARYVLHRHRSTSSVREMLDTLKAMCYTKI